MPVSTFNKEFTSYQSETEHNNNHYRDKMQENINTKIIKNNDYHNHNDNIAKSLYNAIINLLHFNLTIKDYKGLIYIGLLIIIFIILYDQLSELFYCM